jgi:hypothetical protein
VPVWLLAVLRKGSNSYLIGRALCEPLGMLTCACAIMLRECANSVVLGGSILGDSNVCRKLVTSCMLCPVSLLPGTVVCIWCGKLAACCRALLSIRQLAFVHQDTTAFITAMHQAGPTTLHSTHRSVALAHSVAQHEVVLAFVGVVHRRMEPCSTCGLSVQCCFCVAVGRKVCFCGPAAAYLYHSINKYTCGHNCSFPNACEYQASAVSHAVLVRCIKTGGAVHHAWLVYH